MKKMTTQVEYKRLRNLFYLVVAVIIILAILRMANIGLSTELAKEKPLRDTAAGYSIMIISIVAVIGLIWYFTKKK